MSKENKNNKSNIPMGYCTAYFLKRKGEKTKIKKYGTYIIAKNLKKCKRLIKLRGINEIIESQRMDLTDKLLRRYSLFTDQQYLDEKFQVLHYISFLTFIVSKSQKITLDDILSDTGLIHEMSHFYLGFYDNPSNPIYNDFDLLDLRKKLYYLESKCKGLFIPIKNNQLITLELKDKTLTLTGKEFKLIMKEKGNKNE